MKIMPIIKNQKGLAPVLIVIVVAAAAVLLLVGFMFWNKSKEYGLPPGIGGGEHGTSGQAQSKDWPLLWGSTETECQERKVKFSALPINISDISVVEPMGELREGHIIPGDHVGIEYKTSPTSTPVKVFAPADGTIVNVERHAYSPPSGYPKDVRHYHFYIVHSCTLFTGFVHLTEFSPEILAASPQLKQLNEKNVSQYTNLRVNIPVKAGQQIGTAWTFGLLGIVTVDLNHTNKGYLNTESYKGENWRPHDVSLFEYLEEPLKSQIMAKNPRKVEPRGGKIDFDIDGKAVGGWFEKGTGGFRDDNKKPSLCGNFPCPYWDGHLAFVYDYIDPTQLRVSVGHDWGLSGRTPFGVKGNGPDFKEVDVSDSLVKYELVGLKDVSREKGYEVQSPLITENDETKFMGTMLVQVADDGLKMEIFSGKTASEVSGFTSGAKVYER